jgi:type II secretory pathway pseudopilin PulG
MRRNRQWMTAVLGAALMVAPGYLGATAQSDQANNAKHDMKAAGHDTKDAAKDTGKGAKSGYKASEKGTKKAYNKTKNTTKGAVKGGKQGAKEPQ